MANVPASGAEKDGRGAPGSGKAPRMAQRLVLMSDDDWAYCRAQPEGASPFVRRLAMEHMAGPDRPPADSGRPGMARAIVMHGDLWAFCGSQPGGAGPFLRRLVRAHRQYQEFAK